MWPTVGRCSAPMLLKLACELGSITEGALDDDYLRILATNIGSGVRQEDPSIIGSRCEPSEVSYTGRGSLQSLVFVIVKVDSLIF